MIMRSQFFQILALGVCFSLSFAATDALAQYPGFGDPGSRTGPGVTGDGLVPVAPTIDGGTIPIGATAQVVVRFRNDGTQPVQTGLIRLYPSSTVSGTISLDQCKEVPLESGAECAIALSVKGLQSGPWRMEMLMSHSGRTRLVSATLSGTVEAGEEGADKLISDVEVIPDELDFGSLDEAQTLVQPVILRNITSTPIAITDIYIDTSEQAGYSLKTECKSLQAGQACIAVVTWSPKLRGRSSGVLVIKHDGPAALASVPLKGEYTPNDVDSAEVFPQAVPGRGLLVSSQTDIDFGADVQTASTMTVSLVNAGDAPINIKDIRISGSDNGLSFKPEGCAPGAILEPIEACPLTITWSPTRVGSLFDDIQVVHDGARGILVLPIRGGSTSTVSQDQKAIVLSEGGQTMVMSSAPPPGPPPEDETAEQAEAREAAAEKNAAMVATPVSYAGGVNPASVLDGYKITSFATDKAIINGPGGSRIVFNDEEIVLGGIPWFVVIQKNGIEFLHQGQRILLLFDRSLSSINRVSASSSKNKTSGSGSSSSSSSSTTSSDSGSSSASESTDAASSESN